MTSKHYENDRIKRETLIATIGQGKVVYRFTVDHKGKKQIHEVTDHAIIIVRDCKTGKVITKLIARAPQIKRYFPEGQYPVDLVKLAKEHEKMDLFRVK